jgi:hypothetical protein
MTVLRRKGLNLTIRSGRDNHRYRPVGTVRVVIHGGRPHVLIKCSDADGYNARWRMLAAVVWERARGAVPPGHCLWHIDGDGRNCRLENLELITLAERLRRNMAASPERVAAARVANARKISADGAAARRLQAHRRRVSAKRMEAVV